MATSPNPFYGTQTDLTQPVSSLARAMVGSAADDAYMARSQASLAQGRKFDLEANALQDQEASRRRLSQSPDYQRSIASAFGLAPSADGVLPPEIADIALQYLARGGNIEQFAKANRTTQGVGAMNMPGATEDNLRIGGALLGLEPDKNTAYTVPRADAILEGDYGVRRRGQDVTANTTRRGQDITSSDNIRNQDLQSDDRRRGQDLTSTDRQRGQDMTSNDRRRGQDMRPAGGASTPAFNKVQLETAAGMIDSAAKDMGVKLEPKLRTRILEEASVDYQKSKNILTAVTNAFRLNTSEDAAERDKSIFSKDTLRTRTAPTTPASPTARPANNAPVIDKLPAGAQQVGTSGGKPVYELNGKRYIQD